MKNNLLSALVLMLTAMLYAWLPATAFAQNAGQAIAIHGTVVDSQGEPVIGAGVIEKANSANGVISLTDGTFVITVKPGAVLQFSSIGYADAEVPAAQGMIVTLEDNVSVLEESVVVGYGTVSVKNLTTSIAKVKPDNISKASNSNMAQLMMGRAAGLQATVASAQPGGQVNMSIRGAGTPIYIVDGVIVPDNSLEGGAGGITTVVPAGVNRSGLAGLNPEDIESVEVLKDAAASIYGIGAANGVIMITTKKGKQGAPTINYDGSQSIVTNYKYLDILDAQQYMGLVNTFSKEQYLYNNSMAPYGPNAYDDGWTPNYTDNQIAAAQTTDWKNLVLRNGSIANHNITVSGGNKGLTYYLSGNYFNQKGSVSNSGMERFAFRSNVSYQLFPFLKLTSVVNVNRNTYNNSTVGGTGYGRGEEAMGALSAALSYPPMIPVKDEDGEYSKFLQVPNAVGMEDIDDQTKTNGTYINFSADIDIIKDMLKAKLLYGDNLESSRRSTYIPSYVFFDNKQFSRGNLGIDNRNNQTMEATLSFTKQFGKILNVDAVVGMGRYLNDYDGINVAYDHQHDAIRNDDISAATGTTSPGSYRSANEKRSQFFRANLDFLDRYVVAFTVRRDGTDKFFPTKKYSWFPSVSAAWKVSNESFMKNVDWLNLLKIRGSYGVTGSDNLGSSLYGYYEAFDVYAFFNNNSVSYVPFVSKGVDYPDVTWEKTTMLNFGVDFSVLNDRIWGSFDIFRNDITNLLGYDTTAGLSTYGNYPVNGAHRRRYGWDATLNTENVKTRNFNWSSVLTLSKYNSVWIERFPNYDYKDYQIRDHEPANARYYYETNGIINADLSNMPASQPEAGQKPGFPIIVDQNNDGQITTADVKMTNEVPKLYFGFGNTFTLGNFDLDIFLYSQLGVNKYNYALDWAVADNLANARYNSNTFAYDMWNSQTNPNGTLPGLAYERSDLKLPGDVGTDLKYQNSSFVRVRNITLGYNLSGKSMGAVGKYLHNLRIYVDAQNPFTFTKFVGFDPEINTGGGYKGGKAEYPMTRTFTGGLKLTF